MKKPKPENKKGKAAANGTKGREKKGKSRGGKTKNMYFYIFMVEKSVIWCIVTTKIFNK